MYAKKPIGLTYNTACQPYVLCLHPADFKGKRRIAIFPVHESTAYTGGRVVTSPTVITLSPIVTADWNIVHASLSPCHRVLFLRCTKALTKQLPATAVGGHAGSGEASSSKAHNWFLLRLDRDKVYAGEDITGLLRERLLELENFQRATDLLVDDVWFPAAGSRSATSASSAIPAVVKARLASGTSNKVALCVAIPAAGDSAPIWSRMRSAIRKFTTHYKQHATSMVETREAFWIEGTQHFVFVRVRQPEQGTTSARATETCEIDVYQASESDAIMTLLLHTHWITSMAFRAVRLGAMQGAAHTQADDGLWTLPRGAATSRDFRPLSAYIFYKPAGPVANGGGASGAPTPVGSFSSTSTLLSAPAAAPIANGSTTPPTVDTARAIDTVAVCFLFRHDEKKTDGVPAEGAASCLFGIAQATVRVVLVRQRSVGNGSDWWIDVPCVMRSYTPEKRVEFSYPVTFQLADLGLIAVASRLKARTETPTAQVVHFIDVGLRHNKPRYAFPVMLCQALTFEAVDHAARTAMAKHHHPQGGMLASGLQPTAIGVGAGSGAAAGMAAGAGTGGGKMSSTRPSVAGNSLNAASAAGVNDERRKFDGTPFGFGANLFYGLDFTASPRADNRLVVFGRLEWAVVSFSSRASLWEQAAMLLRAGSETATAACVSVMDRIVPMMATSRDGRTISEDEKNAADTEEQRSRLGRILFASVPTPIAPTSGKAAATTASDDVSTRPGSRSVTEATLRVMRDVFCDAYMAVPGMPTGAALLLRDPLGLAMECLIAGAYLQSGTRWRHLLPPRGAFDLSYFVGLLHPAVPPRGSTPLGAAFVMQHATTAQAYLDCAARNGVALGLDSVDVMSSPLSPYAALGCARARERCAALLAGLAATRELYGCAPPPSQMRAAPGGGGGASPTVYGRGTALGINTSVLDEMFGVNPLGAASAEAAESATTSAGASPARATELPRAAAASSAPQPQPRCFGPPLWAAVATETRARRLDTVTYPIFADELPPLMRLTLRETISGFVAVSGAPVETINNFSRFRSREDRFTAAAMRDLPYLRNCTVNLLLPMWEDCQPLSVSGLGDFATRTVAQMGLWIRPKVIPAPVVPTVCCDPSSPRGPPPSLNATVNVPPEIHTRTVAPLSVAPPSALPVVALAACGSDVLVAAFAVPLAQEMACAAALRRQVRHPVLNYRLHFLLYATVRHSMQCFIDDRAAALRDASGAPAAVAASYTLPKPPTAAGGCEPTAARVRDAVTDFTKLVSDVAPSQESVAADRRALNLLSTLLTRTTALELLEPSTAFAAHLGFGSAGAGADGAVHARSAAKLAASVLPPAMLCRLRLRGALPVLDEGGRGDACTVADRAANTAALMDGFAEPPASTTDAAAFLLNSGGLMGDDASTSATCNTFAVFPGTGRRFAVHGSPKSNATRAWRHGAGGSRLPPPRMAASRGDSKNDVAPAWAHLAAAAGVPLR